MTERGWSVLLELARKHVVSLDVGEYVTDGGIGDVLEVALWTGITSPHVIRRELPLTGNWTLDEVNIEGVLAELAGEVRGET